MTKTITASRRADGALDYRVSGPHEFKQVLPPEKLSEQLQANNASRKEAETFIEEINRNGTASLSFEDRKHKFSAGNLTPIS